MKEDGYRNLGLCFNLQIKIRSIAIQENGGTVSSHISKFVNIHWHAYFSDNLVIQFIFFNVIISSILFVSTYSIKLNTVFCRYCSRYEHVLSSDTVHNMNMCYLQILFTLLVLYPDTVHDMNMCYLQILFTIWSMYNLQTMCTIWTCTIFRKL